MLSVRGHNPMTADYVPEGRNLALLHSAALPMRLPLVAVNAVLQLGFGPARFGQATCKIRHL